MPLIPLLSVAASVWLMLNLESATWWRFAIWFVVGLVVYFLYGMRHSRLAARAGEGTGPTAATAVE